MYLAHGRVLLIGENMRFHRIPPYESTGTKFSPQKSRYKEVNRGIGRQHSGCVATSMPARPICPGLVYPYHS